MAAGYLLEQIQSVGASASSSGDILSLVLAEPGDYLSRRKAEEAARLKRYNSFFNSLRCMLRLTEHL